MKIQISKTHKEIKRNPKRGFAKLLLVDYLKTNLSQITYTFWLSVFVMIFGFGILVWGISKVFNSPDSILSAAIVSGAGVITEFIGVTFLFIYRATQMRAEQYFKTVERISTSEIVEEILENLPEELANKVKANVAESMVKDIYSK